MTTSNRRAWYKLHLSTWLVALAALAILVLIVVPGNSLPVFTFAGIPGSPQYEHGWPLVWLDRVDAPVADDYRVSPSKLLLWAGDGDINWTDRKAWPLAGTFFVRWKGLLLDLLIAGVITAAIAGCWEFWRRRHFQYSIRALLALALLVSLIMAYWRVAAIRWARESPSIAQVKDLDAEAETTSAAPDWLCRLVGRQRFPSLITKLNVSRACDVDKLKSALVMSQGFSTLRALDFDGLYVGDIPNDETMEIIAAQFNAKRGGPTISGLTINGTELTEAGYRAIAKMTELQLLEIHNAVATRAELEAIASLPHLRRLFIETGGLTQQDIDSFRKHCPACEVEWVNQDAPPDE